MGQPSQQKPKGYQFRPIPGGTHHWVTRDGIQLGIVDAIDDFSHFSPKKGLPTAEIAAVMQAVKSLKTSSNPPVNIGFEDE